MDFLSLLPAGLRPYAKAVTPAALALAAAIVTAITSGQTAGLEVALVGVLAASVTFGVANLPTGWRAYAKAIVPAVLTLVTVPVHFLITGDWNSAEWTIAITGLGSALVAFLTPNDVGAVLARAAVTADPGPVPLLADEEPAALALAQQRAAAEKPPTRPAS